MVEKTILDNGIRVVTERMPFVRSVSIGVWVKAGSSNETVDNNGISHFLEHMLFKGTTTRSASEIAQSLESLGGGLNGSTGKELSLYSAHVLDEHVEIAVDVLADLVQNPQFNKEDIELERQVVLAEINHSIEDPEEHLLDNFYENLFNNHPLGYFIYGTPENILKFCQNDFQRYLTNEYTLERMVFAAAGNIEHNSFVKLVEKYTNSATKMSQILPNQNIPIKINPYKKLVDNSLHQSHICTGVSTVGFLNEKKYALVLCDVLLGSGMSSRLFQNIREKYGFAYNIYSFIDIMEHTGVFGVYMACSTDKLEQSIELVQKEFNEIRTHKVSADELSRLKEQVKGSLILGMESSSRRMRKIGESEIYNGPHRSLDEIVEKIDAVTMNDIFDLANEFFAESNFCLTCMTPH